jgi:hypothetical protein
MEFCCCGWRLVLSKEEMGGREGGLTQILVEALFTIKERAQHVGLL